MRAATPRKPRSYVPSAALLTAKDDGTPYASLGTLIRGIKTRLSGDYDYREIDNKRIVNWLQANEEKLEGMYVDELTSKYFNHVSEQAGYDDSAMGLIGDVEIDDLQQAFDKLQEDVDRTQRIRDMAPPPPRISPPDTAPPPRISPPDTAPPPVLSAQPAVSNPLNTNTPSVQITNTPSVKITQAGPQSKYKDVRQTFLRSPEAMAKAAAMGLDLNNQADFQTFLRMSQQSFGPVDTDERDQLTVYGVKRVKPLPPRKFNKRSATVY